jgi:hypothetical protein
MFACTIAKGFASAFPDVCKTPAGPAVVPVPYTNVAQMSAAKGNSVARKVFFDGAKAVMVKSKLAQSRMNEPGTLGGAISNKNMAPAAFKKGSAVLFIEGAAAVFMGSPTLQNGNPFNAVGSVVSPSQKKVMIRR